MIISQLYIYPVKSCAGVAISEMTFDHSGPVGDRRFVIVDENGGFLSQRELPQMANIQPSLSPTRLSLSFHSVEKKSLKNTDISIDIHQRGLLSRVQVWGDEVLGNDCGDDVASWLSEVLRVKCRLMQLPEDNLRRADRHFAPENTGVSYADGFPLLLVSQASLDALSTQAGEVVDVRRFRPNIVVEGDIEAYEEREWKRLVCSHELMGITSCELLMVKPCERCVIPTRHPDTLERSPEVIQALKDQCRIEGRIIFGQNAIYTGRALYQGVTLTLE